MNTRSRFCGTPKFLDVIVNRYIEQCGSDADVFVIRDDMKISYQQLCKVGQYNEIDSLS